MAEQQMHNMIPNTFGESRISKDMELNSSMSVVPKSPDELTNKLNGGLN